ncbi:MAG: hypothetical protein HS116_00015 [Planctomycetes bacterium]|nr:hypothetical protein [Planctomycetota bacterium]
MPAVRGDVALAQFRAEWTGRRILDLVRDYRRLLITWLVGVGKSRNIDDVIETAVRDGRYDLVVVLLPTRRVLNERRWIRIPPPDVRIVNLRPRPSKDCGKARDRRWQFHEAQDLGVLGRVEICGNCPHRDRCFWPQQYGKSLDGAHVIYGTQAHLKRSPAFVGQLKAWAGAERVLVLLDEVGYVMRSCEKTITRKQLELFAATLQRVPLRLQASAHRRWSYLTDLLLVAGTTDLRSSDWRFPVFDQDWAYAVQREGFAIHAKQFRFLGYDFQQFCRSALESRERTADGGVRFALRSQVDAHFVVYSGTADAEFTQFRMGHEFTVPFADYTFDHPDTRWYNIASRLGTKGFFPKNSPQILDFYARLIAQRLKEGRRPILVAKKCFVPLCAAGLNARLGELGADDIRIIVDDWGTVDLSDPAFIPLINFGTIGTNQFENFDCAYCLTGYYVNEPVINEILQDVEATDGHVPIKIVTGGRPRRRTVKVTTNRFAHSDISSLAQKALGQQEIDVVLQAVGRVRPYTRPREIVMFQCAAHPTRAYDVEFSSLGEARKFFGIADRREARAVHSSTAVRAARECGSSQAQVARKLGLSLSTVKRYWI